RRSCPARRPSAPPPEVAGAVQHRVYKLNNRLTIFGLEFSDMGVAAVSFFVMNGLVSATLNTRINILLIVAGTFLITRIWRSVKDDVPDQFCLHLLSWLAEKHRLSTAPALEPAPVIVDVDAVMAARREGRPKR